MTSSMPGEYHAYRPSDRAVHEGQSSCPKLRQIQHSPDRVCSRASRLRNSRRILSIHEAIEPVHPNCSR